MHAYERQDAKLTLAQGIAEYHRRNLNLIRGDQLSVEAQEFFRCHDAAHVIFGCDTTLPDEAAVKLASVFGTTAGFAVLKGYRLRESVGIYKTLRLRDILHTVAASFAIVPSTLVRCARQRKRWPWSDFSDHLDKPLGELRSEYGIRVVRFKSDAAP